MSVHDAFIQSIRDAPDDDVPRLIYADYLEEHGDPVRAEFIRLQCQIARQREDENDPAARQLRSHEYQFLRDHEDAWLGEAAPIRKERTFDPTFRRGFVEACGIAAPQLLEHATTLMRCMPLWTEATLSRGRGLVRQLVSLPEFSQLRRLTFAGQLDVEDTRALAGWPGLAELHSLRFWGGDEREHDREVCNILASSPHTHGLQLMEMIQVRGGIGSDYRDEDGAAWARRLEKRINARFDRPVFRTSRPFEKTFAVKSCEGYGFYAGLLPRKYQEVVARDTTGTVRALRTRV